jgi:hypothetical protein
MPYFIIDKESRGGKRPFSGRKKAKNNLKN